MVDVTAEGSTLISSSPATIAGLSLAATQTDTDPNDMVEVWLYDLAAIPADFKDLEPEWGCFVATELTAPAEGSCVVPIGELPPDMIDFQTGIVLVLNKHDNTGTVTITTS